jgi:hypothetical protein
VEKPVIWVEFHEKNKPFPIQRAADICAVLLCKLKNGAMYFKEKRKNIDSEAIGVQ